MKLTEFHQSCPDCGGPAFSDLILAEKKDACYYKVKASAKVWPSAYASGRLVQCRKKGAGNYGNKSESVMSETNDLSPGAVRKLQNFLNKKFRANLDVDGILGDLTRKSIEQFMPAVSTQLAPAPERSTRVQGFDVKETDQLDEKCWDGYQQQGMKNKGGRQVPNCVPKESIEETYMEQNQDELARILELGGVQQDQNLVEEFDLIESIIEGIAAQNGVDAETVWADLESLTEDELYAFAVTSQLNEDWQKANKQDKTDGMSQKAVNAYRRENPGSKLKTAVTTKPSKLKKGGKASKRRKSYCSRSRGQMKMHSISCAKTPDKAICKARRRWNC
jgi:hypothetical protein